MYYKKLLRLYNLSEDCFNLFTENYHSIESNTVSNNSLRDSTIAAKTVVDPASSVFDAENNVKSIETTDPAELSCNLSRAGIVDCNKCQFLAIEETSPGENDYRCCFNNTYLSPTEVQCDNFEQKAELPIEPEIDDYTG